LVRGRQGAVGRSVSRGENTNGAWLALGAAALAGLAPSGQQGRGSANRSILLPLAAAGALAGGALFVLARRRNELDLNLSSPTPAGAPVAAAAAATTTAAAAATTATATTGPPPSADAPASSAGKPFINPMGNGAFRLSSKYGYRTHPVTGERKLHQGIDLSARQGTPIYAANAGVVSKVWNNHPYNGNALKIKHADGTSTAYLHMVEPTTLALGQQVGRGQQVGKVGSTGLSTGPHLHFVVYKATGETTDPEPFTDLNPWTPAAPAVV